MEMGGGSTGSSARRESLKKRLFKKCDRDGDGRLKQNEMRSLATLVGFEGTDEEWMEEYSKLCEEQNIKLADGIPQVIVMQLLDDDSDNGCYCTDQELSELLAGDHIGADRPHATSEGKGKGARKEAKGLEDDEASSHAVFFAGANYDSEESTLKDFFSQAGKVENFVLFRMPDERSRGMGVVTFSTPEEARAAIDKLHKREVDGRSLLVQEDTKRQGEKGEKGEGKGERKRERNARSRWDDASWHEFGGYESDRQWLASQWAEGPPGKGKGGGKGWKGDGGRDGGWGKSGKKGGHDWDYYDTFSPDIVDYYGYDTDGYTVFFAGASFDTTSSHLKKLFAEAGQILQFWLYSLPDGRSRGMGVVQYASQVEASYAIEIMHTRVVDGRSLLVKIDDVGAIASEAAEYTSGGFDRRAGKGGHDKGWGGGGKGKGKGKGWEEPAWTNRVFFSGAPFHCSEGLLRSYFAELGTIRSFTLFWLNDTRHRGMGVCTYGTNEEAEDVVAKGIVIEGRPLFLKEDTSQFSMDESGKGKGGQAHPYISSESSSYGTNHDRKGRRTSQYDHEYDAYNFAAYDITVDPAKAVFFANVPFETTETHLRSKFMTAGKVLHLILFMTTEGKSRGMGVVEYASQAGAIRAYNVLHETWISGRQVIVDEYRPIPHQ